MHQQVDLRRNGSAFPSCAGLHARFPIYLPERFIFDCITLLERFAFTHVYTYISYDSPRRKCLRPDGHLLFCIADKGG